MRLNASGQREELRQFFCIVIELRQVQAKNKTDKELLILLDELETIALNTGQPKLAARCWREIASFEADAATASA